MSQSVLSLYNAAISLARGKGRLSSLGDNTRPRFECDTWYETLRDVAQEAAHWDVCRSTARLTLLTTRNFNEDWAAGEAEPQYTYRYALPPDLLRPWHLIHYSQFTISWDSTRNRRVLDTNEPNAVLRYGRRSTNPGEWPPSLYFAIIHALAAYITGPLTGQNELAAWNTDQANQRLLEAQAAAVNASSMRLESIPEGLAIRGYTQTPQPRFYYPFGPTFSYPVANV